MTGQAIYEASNHAGDLTSLGPEILIWLRRQKAALS
jgi:hypothetical protein